MKLNEQQMNLLVKIHSNKDLLVGSPKYLAMDDDGELRSYVGGIPTKNMHGFWGDSWNAIPFDSYSQADADILSFIQVNHDVPFDIEKMLRTGLVKTTTPHPLLDVLNECQHRTYKKEKSDIGGFIEECLCYDEVTIFGDEDKFFPDGCKSNVHFFDKEIFQHPLSKGVIMLLSRSKLIVVDATLQNHESSITLKNAKELNRSGHSIILIEEQA
ncbi:TPA: hypothetical protein QCY49_000044 [Bacillus paranthracis]|nr:hypothetical protein [Bacillus paranthracis]